MPNTIRLSKSCIGEQEKNAVMRVLDAGYLGMGQEVMLFEKDLSDFLSNKMHVSCVSTGTSALHLALQACGISEEDEVLVPSITYVASFQAISATGAKPVACDIDLSNGCLDLENAKKKMTSKTKAIMYVHYASGVGDRDNVFAFAQEFGLRVIEDAAHSFGGYYKNKRIGEDGDIICFSFDGIKNITCGEGGAVVSSDINVIEKIRDLRLLGVKKDTENRYAGKRSWDFDVEDQGWRYHMSNVNAAIGREQLKKIDHFAQKKRSLVALYLEQLKDLPVKILDLHFNDIVSHIFPVLIFNQKRDLLKEFLFQQNIETGIHYKPNHLLTKYKDVGYPNAEIFGECLLSLPLHVDLNEEDILRVTSLIKVFFETS